MKRIKEFLKRRELIFIITVYPAMILVALYMKSTLSEWINRHSVYYGMAILVCSVLMIVYVLLEIVTKLYNYELQGDKLKIRQQEGINIEELNNGR